jgi:alkanesulfonate monooxygenase SsuD/methylene tetrahydromethanopterin reductase-like flavin-dependent oxidoreductase (luciferase family)
MTMTFGIHVGHLGGPLAELRRLWRFADERGFDWFSVSDHFQESPPQGGELDCLEAVSTMTAAAADTRHVRVGCLVFCINYRNPGLLAKALCTADQVSGGRVECGIGAGWHEIEYRAFGIPFAPIGVREDQLEEYAQVLRLLFDEKVASFAGRHFQLQDARCNPKPLQPRLRLWIGGQGEKRTLRAVARYADGWNAPYLDPGQWKEKNLVLDEWCAREKRDPKAIIRTVNLGLAIGADERRAKEQEAKLQSMFGALTEYVKPGHLVGTPPQVRDRLGAYQRAGAQWVILALRAPFDWEGLDLFIREVMPAFA